MRDIVKEPPTIEELRTWHTRSGLSLRRFFNTSGQRYRELGLKDKMSAMTQEQQYALLASDGMLVKRPLVIPKEPVLEGFRAEALTEILSC